MPHTTARLNHILTSRSTAAKPLFDGNLSPFTAIGRQSQTINTSEFLE
ncbi:hypothetical protein [Pantanalinema sp. GBBB05]